MQDAPTGYNSGGREEDTIGLLRISFGILCLLNYFLGKGLSHINHVQCVAEEGLFLLPVIFFLF